MDRIIYIDGSFGGEAKYKLKREYEGFGLYKEMTPSGYEVHQSFLITNGDVVVVSKSFNNLCYDEMLDMIDKFKSTNKFGKKMFEAYDETNKRMIKYIHPSGNMN